MMGYKSDENKRIKQFNVKLTEEEHQRYRRLAELRGITLAEITRELLNDYYKQIERKARKNK